MSTSIILLDQNFNTNNVDITVFDSCLSKNNTTACGDKKHGPRFRRDSMSLISYYLSIYQLD